MRAALLAMGTGDTRVLRSPKKPARAASSEPSRGERRAERELSITDPAGHQRYLGRPTYFGPLDPNSLEGFFAARDELERAERRGSGALTSALAGYGLRSAEPWWHIEASFYQRHMIEAPPPRPRSADGTPAPEMLTLTLPPSVEPPVPFEVFCEIAGAQAAWSSRGLDPSREAARHFLLELEELAAVELYWAAELAQSRELARQFARKMLDYKERFSGG